MNLITMTVFQI